MSFGMNKNLFKQLCMNFNKDADKELYNMWEYNLRCFDEEEIKKAISIIISQDKYFPTFSRLLEVIKGIVNKEQLNINENTKREKMVTLKVVPKWLNENIETKEIEEDEEFNKFINEFRK